MASTMRFVALAAVFSASALHAASNVSTLRYSSDVTVAPGVVIGPHTIASETIAGATVSLLSIPPVTGAQIDGYAVAGNRDHLISYDSAVVLGGITFQAQDIARYNGSTYTMYFDGSARGLPDGTNLLDFVVIGSSLYFVVDTATTIGGIDAGPQDVLRFNGTNMSHHFDGAVNGMPAGVAIDGLHILPSGRLLLSFDISGAVGPVIFDDEDVVEYRPSGDIWEMLYDGSSRFPSWQSADLRALSACGPPLVSPAAAAIPAAGGGGSITVTAGNGCSWTASSNRAFVDLSTPSSHGDRTITYTVSRNQTCAAREAILTIAGRTVTITQAAGTGSYTLSPTQATIPSDGGSGSINVTATAGCGWTAASNRAYITITAGAAGTGNGTVSYTVGENTSSNPRGGTITIANRTFAITQEGVAGIRGDANGDGVVTVSDVFYLINFLFADGPPPIGNGDANANDSVTVSDVFYLINYLFAAGPPPPPL